MLAQLYRDAAARCRATAESFRLWPDEAQRLLQEAAALEAKAAAAEAGSPADDD